MKEESREEEGDPISTDPESWMIPEPIDESSCCICCTLL